MNGSYLLDTSVVIGLFASDLAIVEKIKSAKEGIYIPSIVLGELFFMEPNGQRKRKRIEKELSTWR